MKNNHGKCEIEETISALQARINSKRIEIQQVQAQSASSPVLPQLFSSVLDKTASFYPQLSHSVEKGKEFAQNFIQKAQQQLEEKPWETVRQVAAYSFAIGLFLSLRHKRSSARENE